jgi:hypothetical protein
MATHDVPKDRCPECYHFLLDHATVYVAEGGGAGKTIVRCKAFVRGHRCKCVRPVSAAHVAWVDDDPDDESNADAHERVR